MGKTVSKTVPMVDKDSSLKTPMKGVLMEQTTMQMAWSIAVIASVKHWQSAVAIPVAEEIRGTGMGIRRPMAEAMDLN